jgi:signal transduction histidine kinase
VAAVRSNLVQVFVNLLTNACHATAPGGVIELATSVAGGEVHVRVQDNGSGIAPEHLSQIFEPFFTTKPDGKGTGLGLSIVQEIVHRHGGVISVDSKVGEGTAFSLKLPVLEE